MNIKGDHEKSRFINDKILNCHQTAMNEQKHKNDGIIIAGSLVSKSNPAPQ